MMNFHAVCKKITASLLTGALFLGAGILPASAEKLENIPTGFAKNVILMIPDGMAVGGVTLTRWVKNDGRPLYMDEIASGLVRTHNADTPIADSAPAGTAMATGIKTQDKLIGVRPSKSGLYASEKVDQKTALFPIANLAEAARFHGKSTGIIATSEIQHATPADFSAHAVHRNHYTAIGEQQVYQNFDVMMGGGADYLLPDKKGSQDPKNKARIDGENMKNAIQEQGYTYVTNRSQLMSTSADKIWGAFAGTAMTKDADRPVTEPSLAEMTDKALSVLSKNPNGFFLMVEGSQVDWAAHANDAIGILSEIKAFDEAVGKALTFAKSNKDTVVLVATDHANSGLTIGNRETDSTYPEVPLEEFTQYLKKYTMTADAAADKYKKKEFTLKQVFSAIGIDQPTEQEISRAQGAISKDKDGKEIDKTAEVLYDIVAKRSKIGFTTHGHTGEDVTLYCYAPSVEKTLTGTIDNTDIAKYLSKAMGADLSTLSKYLFVPHQDLVEQGYKAVLDPADPANTSLLITLQGKSYRFPENKNYFLAGDQKIAYKGINVFNGQSFFVPQEGLNLLPRP